MKQLTVGVVGAGQIVRDIHLPVLAALPDVRVAWIVDAVADRARAAGRDFGIPAIEAPGDPAALPACDVALLGVPAHVREGYFRAFAVRATAVLAEKPFTIGATDHRRCADLFPEHRVACGYMRRFYEGTATLRRAVLDRPFGAVRAVRIAEGDRAKKTGFDATFLDRPSRDGGGVLWAIGCHVLDLAVYLTDAREFEIVSRDVVFDADTDREASAEILLRGRDEAGSWTVPFQFCASWLGPQSNRVEIEFERATVAAGLGPDSVVSAELASGARLALSRDGSPAEARTSYQAFYLEWRDFLDGVAHSRASRIAASTSLLTTQLVDALLGERARR